MRLPGDWLQVMTEVIGKTSQTADTTGGALAYTR